MGINKYLWKKYNDEVKYCHLNPISKESLVINENYLIEFLDKDEKFNLYLKDVKAKFNGECNNCHEYIFQNIPKLVEIKNKLKKDIPLPDKYQDEQHVNSLLALVLDKRADTLKEAINLYETEQYRSNVISSLDLLNMNLVILNNNISSLKDDIKTLTDVTVKGFRIMISQNNMISNLLTSIAYDTKYLVIDEILN